MHRLLVRRLAALILTTLLALSVAHVLFNGGLEKMTWGAATVDTPAHLVDIYRLPLVSGQAAIEYGFGLPGMFLTIRGAIISQDIPVLEALVLEGVMLIVIANFLVDAFQDDIDPRLRASHAG